MQKFVIIVLFTFSVITTSTFAMDMSPDEHIIIAAWLTSDKMPFEPCSEFVISHNSNGTRSVMYTCRPKGIFSKPCTSKAILEISAQSKSLLLALAQDEEQQLHLQQLLHTASVSRSWYKHSVATHGAAVVSAILLMTALFH